MPGYLEKPEMVEKYVPRKTVKKDGTVTITQKRVRYLKVGRPYSKNIIKLLIDKIDKTAPQEELKTLYEMAEKLSISHPKLVKKEEKK
jgi:hypothetical protein